MKASSKGFESDSQKVFRQAGEEIKEKTFDLPFPTCKTSSMNFVLNLIWLFCGGFFSALTWMLASVVLFLTIIGIPWGRATFNIGVLVLWPFGSKAISRELISGEDLGTGFLGFVGNLIWFVFAGWWLFLYHLGCAIVMAVTIIGIPFAFQYWKLAQLSLSPIGKTIVPR